MTIMTLTYPRPEIACIIAGSLAQAATLKLTLQLPGKNPAPLSPRTTDLPALLRKAEVGTRLLTSDGGQIELTDSGCTVSGASRVLVQAFEQNDR
jgi:hypothetical protein